MRSSWCVEVSQPQEIARTRWSTLRSVLEAAAHICQNRRKHVPILTDMFTHCLIQEAIPGSVTQSAITLLKNSGRHVWEELDDYRPITLPNTELKILARVLANRLQLVISDLIGPEQTYAVKIRLRDEVANPAPRGIPFAGPLTARVSMFADDITVFVSCCLDIKALKKAVAKYEQIAGAKVNFDKSKGLHLVPGRVVIPYQSLSARVTDLSVSLGCDSGLTSNWIEIGRKYRPR